MGKKQHYVPRMILRNFATDESKNSINIYLVKQNKFIYSGALYGQAYGNNLYGSDQKLETAFQLIESGFCSALDKLRVGNLTLTDEEISHIKIFILFQYNRTPAAVKFHNDSLNQIVKNLAVHDKKLKNHLDDFTVGLNNPYLFLFKMSVDMSYVINDLKIGLVENSTESEYVIGEHPIVIINPFLCSKMWPGSKNGLGVKGAVIIFPISPKYSLILYDGQRYKLANFKKKVNASDQDVSKLNLCQFFNTDNCIYFNKPSSETYYTQLNTDSTVYRQSTKSTLDVYPQKKNKKEKTTTELVKMGTKDLPIEQTFSFLAMTEQSFYEDLGNTMNIEREYLTEIRRYMKKDI